VHIRAPLFLLPSPCRLAHSVAPGGGGAQHPGDKGGGSE